MGREDRKTTAQRSQPLRDVEAELEEFAALGVEACNSREALDYFRQYVRDLKAWRAGDNMSELEIADGVTRLIIGAYSMHGHAAIQREGSSSDADASYSMAQHFLHVAVQAIQVAIRNEARSAAGSATPHETTVSNAVH